MTKKSKSPGNTLTVVIINESPLNWGASPTYRSVQIRLTRKQQEAIALRAVGISGGDTVFESVDKAFIEPFNHFLDQPEEDK